MVLIRPIRLVFIIQDLETVKRGKSALKIDNSENQLTFGFRTIGVKATPNQKYQVSFYTKNAPPVFSVKINIGHLNGKKSTRDVYLTNYNKVKGNWYHYNQTVTLNDNEGWLGFIVHLHHSDVFWFDHFKIEAVEPLDG
ncbi:MAG: hypothetical protein D3926_18155 [Desulfobacteraceae bacterium]|nr:MAG: hypothetical protein D3926_18155 [Desulfobacteraceae bacterium]